jgi:dTDP-4-dehydrorhamnose reductase
VIVNAAAYTAVDNAEKEEALATRINGEAPGVLAEEARRLGALLIHYSTDYVFDGGKPSPYLETDPPNPMGAYGRSKLAGERAIAAAGGDWLTLRTSWVYAARGKNFLRTILRLAAEREELRVVADQFGAPTWARLIAESTAQIVAAALRERATGTFASGIYHLTAAGETSWHGFASIIVDQARKVSLQPAPKVQRIVPITTEEYPLPAPRPRNSRMSLDGLERRFGLALPAWDRCLSLCLAELQTAS